VLGGYSDLLRDAVLRCKKPAGDGLSRALGELLVDVHGGTLSDWGIDRIAAVPMHWRRRFVRGTSAADELAAAIAARLQRPCRRLLRRRMATRMQNELPVADRRANVHDAFALRRSAAGAHVLLVDDVCTTGATLSTCAQTLKAAGAAAVYAVAVARAEPGHMDAREEGVGENDD
jgi:competence protein ComFC